MANEKSVFEYCDISICSLHATKLYHSIEGGLVITNDQELLKRLAFIRNFGFNGPEAFAELGFNGKNSEFHAAMGLVNLKYINNIHQNRRNICKLYDEKLVSFRAVKQLWNNDASKNYAYYPVILESEELLLKIIDVLSSNKIFVRRYFIHHFRRSYHT